MARDPPAEVADGHRVSGDLDQLANIWERRRQRLVQRCQFPAVLPRQRHQIVVGHLFMPPQPALRQSQVGNIVRPEDVIGTGHNRSQQFLRLRNRNPNLRPAQEPDE